MSKLSLSLSLGLSITFNFSNAQVDLSVLTQALSAVPSQSANSNPINSIVPSLLPQTNGNKLESSTSTLTKQGAWYVFQNGNWRLVNSNDNFSDMNIALLVHDLAKDKSSLNSLALWLIGLSDNLTSLDTNSNKKKYFQSVLAFEYPSMKSFQNRKKENGLISAIGEEFAPQLIMGAKNIKSLTIFAHGLGGLIGRYTLQQEFPELIKKDENSYKNIFKKIRFITLGTPHAGLPPQVCETAYKSFNLGNGGNALPGNLTLPKTNSLLPQNPLLGSQGNGILNVFFA